MTVALERIFNLTPHAVVIKPNDKSTIRYGPSGVVCRLVGSSVQIENADLTLKYEVPIYSAPVLDKVVGLPQDKTTTIIVSQMVAEFMANSDYHKSYDGDILYPDTGPDSVIRNEKGEIEAVKRLCTYKPK